MDINVTTPAVLFPAVSLLLLASPLLPHRNQSSVHALDLHLHDIENDGTKR